MEQAQLIVVVAGPLVLIAILFISLLRNHHKRKKEKNVLQGPFFSETQHFFITAQELERKHGVPSQPWSLTVEKKDAGGLTYVGSFGLYVPSSEQDKRHLHIALMSRIGEHDPSIDSSEVQELKEGILAELEAHGIVVNA